MKRWTLILPPLLILLIMSLMLLFAGGSQALGAGLLSPFQNPLLFGKMLHRTATLLIPGLAICLAFSAGMFNLGGEGQIYLGGICGLLIHLALPQWPGAAVWPLAWLTGTLAGAALGALSSWMKRAMKVEILISSYLLSLGITQILDGWIIGPLKDTQSYLMTTRAIAEQQRLTPWMPPSRLNGSLLIALGLVVLAYYFLYQRREGYFWRLNGRNVTLAKYAGSPVNTTGSLAMIISGGLNGLTGALLISGSYYMGLLGFSQGLGWDAMAVALMAELHPLILVPASFFYSLLTTGAENAQLMGHVSVDLKGFILALAFFLVSSRIILLRLRRKS